jgi:hypothetical protein
MALSLKRCLNEVVNFSACVFNNIPDLNIELYPLLLTNRALSINRPKYI